MQLHEYPVIVVMWGMPECPACQEYKPRFRAVAERYAGCIPAAVINTDTVDDRWLAHYGVHEVPATMVIRRGKVTARRDRPVEDRTIEHLFSLASFGQECSVGDDA